MATDVNLLTALLTHLTLPPRLPPGKDIDDAVLAPALADLALQGVSNLKKLVGDELSSSYNIIDATLEASRSLQCGEGLDKSKLLRQFEVLQETSLSAFLFVQVPAQNAGLLIWKCLGKFGDRIVFEAFEASPKSQDVLTSQCLLMNFPGSSIAFDSEEFGKSCFQENLASLLCRAATENIPMFAEKAQKAGVEVVETRDTADPALITSMLMIMLRQCSVETSCPAFTKRVKDDCVWSKGAAGPWRRAPSYLVLRVALRRLLWLQFGDAGVVHYKYIIASLLATLLHKTLGNVDLEMVTFLKAKLARKIAKLSMQRSGSHKDLESALFNATNASFTSLLKTTTTRIAAAWDKWKLGNPCRRQIELFKGRRAPEWSWEMKLFNSYQALRQILNGFMVSDPGPTTGQSSNSRSTPYTAWATSLRILTSSYGDLHDQDALLQAELSQVTHLPALQACLHLSTSISDHVNALLTAHNSSFHTGTLSVGLLTIFEMWVEMDKIAVQSMPLLKEYHHGFPDDLLDVLQVSSWSDHCRLQHIHSYLRLRLLPVSSKAPTIFAKIGPEAFAVRSFDQCGEMQECLRSIEADAELRRDQKLAECARLNNEYEALSKQLAEHPSCTTVAQDEWPFNLLHDDRGCTKCYLERHLKRLRIDVLEHPLPSDLTQAKAVIFEVCANELFCSYRDGTWTILGNLAHFRYSNESRKPMLLLHEYSGLKPSMSTFVPRSFGLATTAKKSFTQTHYRALYFPVDVNRLFVPCGVQWTYYDKSALFYAHDVRETSLSHHFRLDLHPDSPFANLLGTAAFKVGSKDGPSSNQVIASQSKCPKSLTAHEFLATQMLHNGTHRRWYAILQELGSSNLNFSSESTTQILDRLIHESGSAGKEDEDLSAFRDAHIVFKEQPFCLQLLRQIEDRLSIITHNFREHNCMAIMINMLFRLYALAYESIALEALRLLECARVITSGWMDSLRHEVLQMQKSTNVAPMMSYLLWAAILCRKTFDIARPNFSRIVDTTTELGEANLVMFLASSLALSDSIKNSRGAMPSALRSALISDVKTTRILHGTIRRALLAYPGALLAALNLIWPEPTGCERCCTEVRIPVELAQISVSATINTYGRRPQSLEFNVLTGHVMLDGEAIGRLPEAFSHCPQLLELIGEQSLFCSPSNLPQMAHMLNISPYGHQIHLGRISDTIVIRCCAYGRIFQVLDRSIFLGASGMDLPRPLIDDCTHFFDLQTGIVECRKKSMPWTITRDVWRINLYTRRATRGDPLSPEHLIDVYSPFFAFIARMFRNFESRDNIVVRQPAKFSCMVGLDRMELTFFINSKRLLFCKQLGSEIDPNQDGGTLYGLDSALILRDELDAEKRRILVPVGDLKIKRRGFHVSATIAGRGTYASFGIDRVLGRLTCAADSSVISYLALLHAITSSVIVDPLLMRSGTEEALALLESYCLPSEPLNQSAFENLRRIAALVPKRHWYPADRRGLQTVEWDSELTTTIQHEAYAFMVSKIVERSNSLALFHGAQQVHMPTLSTAELNERAAVSRSHFQRADVFTRWTTSPDDVLYKARHAPADYSVLSNVTKSIMLWPSMLPTSMDVSGILQSFPNIGGFEHAYEYRGSIHKSLTADVALQFGPLTTFSKQMEKDTAWDLVFALGPLAFTESYDLDMLNFWLAFAFFPELKELPAPAWPSFAHYRREAHPTVNTILPLLHHAVVVASEDERTTLRSALNRKQLHDLQTSESEHVADMEKDMEDLAQHLLAQWPTHEPTSEGFESSNMDLLKAMKLITPEFERLFKNLELSRYLDAVQNVFKDRRCPLSELGETLHETLCSPTGRVTIPVVPCIYRNLLSVELDSASKRTIPTNPGVLNPVDQRLAHTSTHTNVQPARPSAEMAELHDILRSISSDTSSVRQQYVDDLAQSLLAFQRRRPEQIISDSHLDSAAINNKVLQSRQLVEKRMNDVLEVLIDAHPQYKWLELGGLWPSLTSVTLLETLRPTSDVPCAKNVRAGIIDLGLALAEYQHAIRLKHASLHQKWKQVTKELHEGSQIAFSPHKYPEWLLLELESGLRIRADQVEVALASIKPESGFNSVLQMNMGMGKTSIIVPAVSSHLAGLRRQVMRVIVPRSLLRQTAVLLLGRLGRLLGAGVLHVPYSRQIDHSEVTTQAFFKLHQEAMKTGSVMLAAPEHILSFKLCGLQALSDGLSDQARILVETHEWLQGKARDLIDESDYVLSPKSGLIFPSGNFSAPDGAPARWCVSQALLKLVLRHLPALKAKFPRSIEIVAREGGYPSLHFLRRDVEEELTKRLTKSLASGYEVDIISLRGLSYNERALVRRFLADPIVSKEDTTRITYLFRDDPDSGKRLLLLRGLLVQRILLLALKKRFNVSYGLDPRRNAPLAVPFISKGTPTELSEWGHPDVAILLTILTFYYSGLSLDQVRMALINISKSDDPVRIYDSFIQETSIPESMRDYDSINEDDGFQVETLWKHVRFSTSVVDYYLNHFVFPRHAKQFSIKLQTNAFDLPLTPANVDVAQIRTTGFSGTNDNRNLLPSNCPQTDLRSLQHTNAMVVTFLLSQRNRTYHVASTSSGNRLSERDLLHRLNFHKIRLLVDAGAMILELSNIDVAKAWLEIDSRADAALYFNSGNEAIIRYRQGKEVPLLISNITSFENILVYIDEAHTRGTDLSLTDNCQGALTLGLSLNKDALMQAAMRLRKLGTTQSVVFFAPIEVHQAILDSRPTSRTTAVDSSDVIRWILSSTATALETLVPLYWSNGANFLNRSQAAWDNSEFLYDPSHTEEFLNKVREREKFTLTKLYKPRHDSKFSQELNDYITAPHLKSMFKELNKRRRAFQDTGAAVHASTLQETEQEAQREVEVEVEVETIKERSNPPRCHAHTFQGLHPEIKSFIETGRLLPARGGYEHAFAALRRSAIGRKFGINDCVTKSRLYSSVEYSRTVVFPDGKPNDAMLRAAQHILYFRGTKQLPETALLISPEEAEACIPLVRRKRCPELHLLLYAAPVTRRMLHFNSLNYCAVPALARDFKAPSWLKLELGIIAGRLYFEYEEYEAIKEFLGIAEDGQFNLEDDRNDDGLESTSASQESERHIREKTDQLARHNLFTSRPISFMSQYLTALRKECDIAATPMAYVLSGKILTANHAFFAVRKVESIQRKLITTHQEAAAPKQEEAQGQGDDLDLLMAGEGAHIEVEESVSSDEEWYETQVEVAESEESKVETSW